jgi:hypothetical protein
MKTIPSPQNPPLLLAHMRFLVIGTSLNYLCSHSLEQEDHFTLHQGTIVLVKRLCKESHFSHVFGHHSNVVVFGWPFLRLFSSLTKAEWREGSVCHTYLGQVLRPIIHKSILQNSHDHSANPHKNHSVMMCQVQAIVPVSLGVQKFR